MNLSMAESVPSTFELVIHASDGINNPTTYTIPVELYNEVPEPLFEVIRTGTASEDERTAHPVVLGVGQGRHALELRHAAGRGVVDRLDHGQRRAAKQFWLLLHQFYQFGASILGETEFAR